MKDVSWLWNPGQTSPEVLKRGISGPTKKTDVLQNFFKKCPFPFTVFAWKANNRSYYFYFSVSWNRGSKNLALDSDRYHTSQDCCLFVLEIPVVQASDAGVYTLHALSSPLGNKSSACFILNINTEEGNEKIDINKLVASIEVRFAPFDRHQLNLFE